MNYPIDEARFWEKVDKADGCWGWNASLGSHGYGQIGWMRKDAGRGMVLAHRYSYELHYGTIPEGLQIDHLCRNRPCTKPEHLEAVTQQENLRRQAAAITHCPQGHEYTEVNTYVAPEGDRRCRACIRVRDTGRVR